MTPAPIRQRSRSRGEFTGRRWVGLLWLTSLLAACAFPAVDYREDEDGGPASSSSSNGPGGAGGGPPACLIGDLGGCGTGNKCTVVDLATGEVGCTEAGNRQWWSRCSLDSDCIEGSFCDPLRLVCKPFCSSSNGCVFNAMQFQGECVPLLDARTNLVPGGHNLCIPNCNPKTAAPCDVSDYVTCVFVGNGRFDCIQSDGEVEGSTCISSAECGGGLVCAEPDAEPAYCGRWCTPVGAASIDCAGNATCVALNPTISYLGTPHGVCPSP